MSLKQKETFKIAIAGPRMRKDGSLATVLETRQGYRVEVGGVTCFVDRRKHPSGWVVTEARVGFIVGKGSTRKEAMEDAQEKMRLHSAAFRERKVHEAAARLREQGFETPINAV